MDGYSNGRGFNFWKPSWFQCTNVVYKQIDDIKWKPARPSDDYTLSTW